VEEGAKAERGIGGQGGKSLGKGNGGVGGVRIFVVVVDVSGGSEAGARDC
jgi:hypothetical protein